jgi:beta-glucosidase
MSVFPRGADASDPLRKINDEINAQLKTLADGKRVHLLDIKAKYLDAEGNLSKDTFPDLLHLSPAAYDIWAEALAPKLKELGVE